MARSTRIAKAALIQGAGWVLVLVGLAAMVLPGPGLLALFAGIALLSTQYDWASRRLEPVKKAALRTAADSVASASRIMLSAAMVLLLIAIGILWGVHPPAPSWWPVAERWWLPGGWGAGASLIFSGLVAAAMIVYSFLNFRGIRDEEAHEIAQQENSDTPDPLNPDSDPNQSHPGGR